MTPADAVKKSKSIDVKATLELIAKHTQNKP
jgi:hypothetical protein